MLQTRLAGVLTTRIEMNPENTIMFFYKDAVEI